MRTLAPAVALLVALLASATGLGCANDVLERYDVCLVTGVPTPDVAAPGDVVVLDGAPYSEDYDTIVRVGGVGALAVDVTREACSACDACRASEGCRTCGTCEGCDADCDTCVQTLSFTVPDVPAGDAPIVVFNRHGTSAPVPFTVVAGPDTDLPDTGMIDTADTDPVDTAPPDTADTADSALG